MTWYFVDILLDILVEKEWYSKCAILLSGNTFTTFYWAKKSLAKLILITYIARLFCNLPYVIIKWLLIAIWITYWNIARNMVEIYNISKSIWYPHFDYIVFFLIMTKCVKMIFLDRLYNPEKCFVGITNCLFREIWPQVHNSSA